MSEKVGRERFALVVSYRGTAYAGWQRQAHRLSLQQVLEEALGRLLGERTVVVGSGRTDAGVHARAQVVHLDARASLPCRALVRGINPLLPDDLRVHWAGRMPASFHARKDAAGKEYRYLLDAEPVIDALELPQRVPLPRDVDLELVRRALPLLVGDHDFSAFANSGGSHQHGRRTLFRAELLVRGARAELRFAGSGFLRGMVRALVGTLFDVGRGRSNEADLRQLLRGGVRGDAGAAAPARGLVLHRVWYPRRCTALDSFPEDERSRLLASWRRRRAAGGARVV